MTLTDLQVAPRLPLTPDAGSASGACQIAPMAQSGPEIGLRAQFEGCAVRWDDVDNVKSHRGRVGSLVSAVGPDVYQELLDAFLGQLPPLTVDLRNAAEVGDFHAARYVAHQLKGGALSFDAVHLDELSDRLLRVGRDQVELLRSVIHDIIEEVAGVNVSLHALVDGHDDPAIVATVPVVTVPTAHTDRGGFVSSVAQVGSMDVFPMPGLEMSTPPKQPDDRYLTAAEAASILQVSPKTVSRWAKEGRLACRETLGGHRRYSRQAIDHLVERSQNLPAASTPSANTSAL